MLASLGSKVVKLVGGGKMRRIAEILKNKGYLNRPNQVIKPYIPKTDPSLTIRTIS